MKVNYVVKMTYLVFLLFGAFPDINFEFLDYLTVGFWFLVFGLIVIAESLWFRRYPFFEIITAGWKLQNEVHNRLKESDLFQEKMKKSTIKKAIFQA
jgi:hypothetical protein